jgi:hypothetical protein
MMTTRLAGKATAIMDGAIVRAATAFPRQTAWQIAYPSKSGPKEFSRKIVTEVGLVYIPTASKLVPFAGMVKAAKMLLICSEGLLRYGTKEYVDKRTVLLTNQCFKDIGDFHLVVPNEKCMSFVPSSEDPGRSSHFKPSFLM